MTCVARLNAVSRQQQIAAYWNCNAIPVKRVPL
jgi:hypothetical protein